MNGGVGWIGSGSSEPKWRIQLCWEQQLGAKWWNRLCWEKQLRAEEVESNWPCWEWKLKAEWWS